MACLEKKICLLRKNAFKCWAALMKFPFLTQEIKLEIVVASSCLITCLHERFKAGSLVEVA